MPPYLTVANAEKLRQLNYICYFNVQELDWLAHNSAFLDMFLNFLQQNNNSEKAIKFVKQIILAVQQTFTPPVNTPVSVSDPICADILAFATLENEVTHNDYTALILHNSYYTFNFANGSSITVEVRDMRFQVEANSNSDCLVSSSAFAATAINTAVAQVQQNILFLDPSTNPAVAAFAKTSLLTAVYRAFENQVRSCNSAYTANVSLSGASNNFDNAPVVNCDANIINCP